MEVPPIPFLFKILKEKNKEATPESKICHNWGNKEIEVTLIGTYQLSSAKWIYYDD